jgi:hypothetical protein
MLQPAHTAALGTACHAGQLQGREQDSHELIEDSRQHGGELLAG